MTRETSPILHLTYSRKGGAGNVAQLLVKSQRDLGYDSRLIAVSDQSISANPLSDPLQALAAAIDQFVLAKPNSELFTVLRNRISRAAASIEEQGAILHLHWLPAAASDAVVSELSRRALKTVWTLHDYRPLTGGCHFPSQCKGFTNGCNDCPQARGFAKGLVERSLDRKIKALTATNITFASPSAGLFEAASRSLATHGHRVELVPNPVAIGVGNSGKRLKVSDSKRYLFVAANVEEKRKGLDKVLSWWAATSRQGERLTLVGQGSEKFQSETQGIFAAGILDSAELETAFENSGALVFASSEDNAPGVLAEAASHGLPIVCLDSDMRTWLHKDGLQALGVDEVRQLSSAEYESLKVSYEQFLGERQPNVSAKRYLGLYFS